MNAPADERDVAPAMSVEEKEIRQNRSRLILTLERIAKDVSKVAYAAKSFDEPGDDWPNFEPVPQHVWNAVMDVQQFVQAAGAAVEQVKRDYKRRCLEWLLAEMQAQLEAS